MQASPFTDGNPVYGNVQTRSGLADYGFATCTNAKILKALSAEVLFMMNQTDGWMPGWMGGWAGGGMWLWTVIGVLALVLLVVAITKLLTK